MDLLLRRPARDDMAEVSLAWSPVSLDGVASFSLPCLLPYLSGVLADDINFFSPGTTYGLGNGGLTSFAISFDLSPDLFLLPPNFNEARGGVDGVEVINSTSPVGLAAEIVERIARDGATYTSLPESPLSALSTVVEERDLDKDRPRNMALLDTGATGASIGFAPFSDVALLTASATFFSMERDLSRYMALLDTGDKNGFAPFSDGALLLLAASLADGLPVLVLRTVLF